MHIKSILTAAAIALVAGLGSASAADQFTALEGITAEPLNAVELDRVRGANLDLSGLAGVPTSVFLAVGLKTARMPINVCPPRPGCLN
ncbi:MAG: hypothetical protein ACU0B1_14810 [Thermohalobaculum sp.]